MAASSAEEKNRSAAVSPKRGFARFSQPMELKARAYRAVGTAARTTS